MNQHQASSRETKKVIAIVQARMGSKRLPGKVMRLINGTPMIGLLLNRLSRAALIDEIVVAISNEEGNEILVNYVQELGYKYYQGSDQNVLARFIKVAELYQAEYIVRITGDCPLVDALLVDECISRFIGGEYDYISNIDPPTYPDGLDIEIVSLSALIESSMNDSSLYNCEHVTPYVRGSGKFKKNSVSYGEDLSHLRWTVDEDIDFRVIQNIFEYFKPEIHFSWLEILRMRTENPEKFECNSHLNRNEDESLGAGQKLWKRATKIIPGGNMLLSKRSEMFLPGGWPSYFSRAKGCNIWDLDGKKYIDMSIMGVGTNTLGYGNDSVDRAVRKAIDNGNMSTFNCPEEVYLAEKLIELHPWAHMVRLARTGGEANAIAVRIARAASGKDKIAVCGYHGWHDWYLSVNLGDGSGLDGHLLPGLEPNGVAKNLQGTVLTFQYNNIKELEKLIRENDIGVIMMEVIRNQGPEDQFLQKVQEIANKNNIVLIFDECTSGFRETFGGIHKKYGVEPDMAVFGKALGNGYAITAIIGKREIMEAAQSTFISSTFWTERVGPVAALATLKEMERLKSWEMISKAGNIIHNKWLVLSQKYKLPISTFGLDAMTGFNFSCVNSLDYKTLITQEMLHKGYLAGNSIYVCTEHSDEIIDDYFNELESVFAVIKQCEEGDNIQNYLKNPVCHAGFKRLN
jgi:glutamate-1-semialdehyde 2,1-aminomutase